MTPKEILNGDKLIAKFMGLEIITDGISWFDTNYKSLGNYSSSWDCLMPVVDKVRSLGYKVTLGHNECAIQTLQGIYKYDCTIVTNDNCINSTYISLLKFIITYNKYLKDNESSTN